MYIIAREADPLGGRPPLQTWRAKTLPEGYAWCDEAFYDVFYSTSPAGFVNITVEGDTVTAMEVNHAAYEAYAAANPPAEPVEELTAEEMIDIMLGVSRYE
jgi:hypothetical protein